MGVYWVAASEVCRLGIGDRACWTEAEVVGTSDGEASMRRDEGGAAAAAGVKTRGEAALEVDERHEALYGRDGVWKGALGELEAEKVGEGECNMAIVRRSRSFCSRSG